MTPVAVFAAALAAAALGVLTLAEWGQLVVFVLLLVGVVVVTPSRRSIKLWREEAEAQKARADRLATDLTGAQQRADDAHDLAHELEKQVAHLQGEMKTLEHYTARGALETLAERLGSLEGTIVNAIQNQGELILKNTEILAKLDEHLDRPSNRH